MKYLVTGGAGFIGSHLVSELLDVGHCVNVLDDFSTGFSNNLDTKHKNLNIIQGDIRNDTLLIKALRGVQGVFHLASKVFVEESFQDPDAYFDVNVNGTLKIIKQCIEHKIQNIVFSSSCAVYGKPDRMPITEDTMTFPLSPYGLSKLTAEDCGRLFSQTGQLSFTVLRYFNVYGRGQRADSPYSGVISLFIEEAKNAGAVKIYGSGKQTRDFIYVKDVVAANLLVMEQNKIGFTIYNCCTNTETSILDLVATIETCTDSNLAKTFFPERKGDILKSKGSYLSLNQATGWIPKFTLQEGLRTLFQN